jgi:hypothetical protein
MFNLILLILDTEIGFLKNLFQRQFVAQIMTFCLKLWIIYS